MESYKLTTEDAKSEIRNKLTIIKGNAQLIEMSDFRIPVLSEKAAVIRKAVDDIVKLMEAL